jgi:catechol-2,3-dioxygenase
MIYGGNATVYVANIDNAIRFYIEVLGLKLTNRFGNHWATVQAGRSLVIGLHPTSSRVPPPGTRGAVQIGLVLSQDDAIGDFVARLRTLGVDASDVLETEAGSYTFFSDPDGNPIYVGDWDPDFDARPGESPEDRLSRQEEEAASAHARG